MKVLLINGPVVDDADSWFYDYFDEPHTCPKSVRAFLEEADGEDIQVSINSGGGSVFAGSEIYTLLKSYAGRVDVVVSGLAASIASVIMLAGDSIKASPMAQVMIHNASMATRGDYRDFEHASVVIGGVSQSLISLYAQRTGLSEEKIKSFVDAETWFGAEQAKELGFVDEVLFNEQISVVASVGSYFSREKINEFKSFLDKKDVQKENPLDLLLNRFDALENKVETFLQKPVAEAKVSIDADAVGEKLAELEKEPVAISPFGKFFN